MHDITLHLMPLSSFSHSSFISELWMITYESLTHPLWVSFLFGHFHLRVSNHLLSCLSFFSLRVAVSQYVCSNCSDTFSLNRRWEMRYVGPRVP